MRKYFKSLLLIILTLLFSIHPIVTLATVTSNINLIKNADMDKPPHRFRKTSDILPIPYIPNIQLNLFGLSTLNISGSSQFSENGLSLIRNSIGNEYNLTVIDLREESHGFINGVAVSFENKQNNANVGLSTENILNDENEKLNSNTLNTPIKFYNDGSIVPEKVSTELELTKDKSISYIRIPVTDGNLPNDDMVEYFVNMVKNQPKDSWFHFHCKAGIGRTTTFMAMYDILKNYNTVSLNDIINRQITLAQLNPLDYNDFYYGNHFKFLNDFYNKCKSNYYNLESFSSLELKDNLSTIDNKYIKNNIKPKYLYVIDENQLLNNINNRISSGYINPKDPNSYTFVYVHVWGQTMNNINYVVNRLKENPNVEIVTPDNFIKLVKNNIIPY